MKQHHLRKTSSTSRLMVASVFGILRALASMEVTAFGKSKQKLENGKPNGMATNPTR